MTDKKKTPAQADLDKLTAARIAARLKASELNETLEEEEYKAQVAEAALNEADRAVRDCLHNSLAAQKKVNSVLHQMIAALKEADNLTKKEKAMEELLKGSSSDQK